VKMDCETSRKNGQVKINAGERSKPECDAKNIDSFHGEIYAQVERLNSYNVTWGTVLTL
jgi:hypothetical protein